MDISRFKVLVVCTLICLYEFTNFENKKNMESEKIILKTIMEFEGGEKLHNVTGDAGGLTRFGIASASHPGVDVAKLTLNDAVEIYKKNYWNPLQLDNVVSDSVKWKIFDIAVNMGVVSAAKLVQSAAKIKVDGIIGVVSIAAINAIDENKFLDELEKLQIHRYATICNRNESQYKFIKGWNRRAFSRFKT